MAKFDVINDKKLIEPIGSAQHKLVYIAPSLSEALAKALRTGFPLTRVERRSANAALAIVRLDGCNHRAKALGLPNRCAHGNVATVTGEPLWRKSPN